MILCSFSAHHKLTARKKVLGTGSSFQMTRRATRQSAQASGNNSTGNQTTDTTGTGSDDSTDPLVGYRRKRGRPKKGTNYYY